MISNVKITCHVAPVQIEGLAKYGYYFYARSRHCGIQIGFSKISVDDAAEIAMGWTGDLEDKYRLSAHIGHREEGSSGVMRNFHECTVEQLLRLVDALEDCIDFKQ